MTSFAANRLLRSFALLGKLRGFCYRYFEKGCRKKCTWQCLSRKVLWVTLSWMFSKEIWKNGKRGHRRVFAIAKGKQQHKIRQLQSQEQRIGRSYPILAFRIVACTFFLTTFLEIVVLKPHCRDCLIGHLHDGVISVYLRKEFNCDRNFLRHQNGHRFIVLKYRHGGHKVMWNGFNLALIGQLHADVTLQVHQNTLGCCLGAN